MTLVVNTVLGEPSRRLTVTGHLIDGCHLDLTARARGTSYASSNLLVPNFGAVDGEVFAGQDRAYAYVAAGNAGLVVVDVADRVRPAIVATLDTPGFANDVKVVGAWAYVADGCAGLRVVDVADPLHPVSLGAVDTSGNAVAVAVRGSIVYVADTSSLELIDVSDPAAPLRVSSAAGASVGVSADRGLAVVVTAAGLRVIDVSHAPAPVVTDAQRLYIGQYQELADDFGVPPQVALGSPTPDTTLHTGGSIDVAASASDDVAVASVSSWPTACCWPRASARTASATASRSRRWPASRFRASPSTGGITTTRFAFRAALDRRPS